MMYIIRLNLNTESFYREISDEGFRSTPNIKEATQFDTEHQAQSMLKSYALQQIYQNAVIERIKN